MDPVVHFELPADDMARAKAFYEKAFGWNVNGWDSKYYMVQTSESDEKTMSPKEPGRVNGGMLKRQNPVQSPVITINVSSIDEAVKKLEAAGGKVVHPKKKVGEFGFSAYFQDTEGNVVGLFQSA